MPYLRCLQPVEAQYALEEVHEGIRGQHLSGRALAHKVLRQGYYLPIIKADATTYVQKCDKCQRFSLVQHQPTTPIQNIISPLHFATWGNKHHRAIHPYNRST